MDSHFGYILVIPARRWCDYGVWHEAPSYVKCHLSWKPFIHYWKESTVQNLNVTFLPHNPNLQHVTDLCFSKKSRSRPWLCQGIWQFVPHSQRAVVFQVYILQICLSQPLSSLLIRKASAPVKKCTFLKTSQEHSLFNVKVDVNIYVFNVFYSEMSCLCSVTFSPRFILVSPCQIFFPHCWWQLWFFQRKTSLKIKPRKTCANSSGHHRTSSIAQHHYQIFCFSFVVLWNKLLKYSVLPACGFPDALVVATVRERYEFTQFHLLLHSTNTMRRNLKWS